MKIRFHYSVIRTVAATLTLACGLSAQTATELWDSYVANPDNHTHIPNNSFAGYMRGEFPIPQLPVVANVMDFGAQPIPGFDNTHAFQAALDHAGTQGGGAVLAPAGRYEFEGMLFIRHSGVVLRGMGTEEKVGSTAATILEFNNNLESLLTYRNTDFTPWSWTGGHIWISPIEDTFINRHRGLDTFDFIPWDSWEHNQRIGGNYNGNDPHPWEYWRRAEKLADIVGEYPRGATSLTLTDASQIQPGQMIVLHWQLDNELSLPHELADYPSWSIQNWHQAGSSEWLRPPLYNRYQWPVEVAAVNGNTITLRQPLRVAIKDGSSDGINWGCQVYAMGSHLRNVGVEHLTVRGFNTIEYIDGSPYSGNFKFEQDGAFSTAGWTATNATLTDGGEGLNGGRIATVTQTASNGSITYTLSNLPNWQNIYVTVRAKLGTASSYSILIDGVTSHRNFVNTANLTNTDWVEFGLYAKNNDNPTMQITFRINGGTINNEKTLLIDDLVVYPSIEDWREKFSGGFTAVHMNRVVNGWVRDLETIDNHLSVVSSACKNLTISDVTIRNETNRSVHNLINSRVESADNLIEGVRFLVPLESYPRMRGHMGLLNEWLTSGNVFKDIYMEHGCFDYHRAVPFDIIHTNQVLIRNTAEQGGNAKAGPALGRRAVHWNLDVEVGTWVNMPKMMPNGALVGVRGPIDNGFINARGVTDGFKGTLIVEPNTVPAILDLHAAQLEHRLQGEVAAAEVTWPAHGATIPGDGPLSIKVRGADFSNTGINALRLFANGTEIASVSGSQTLIYDWTEAPYGKHSLHAEITVGEHTIVSNRIEVMYGVERTRIGNMDPRLTYSDMVQYNLSDKALLGGVQYLPDDTYLNSVHKTNDYFRPRGQFEVTFTGIQLDVFAADVFEGGSSSQFVVCEVFINDMSTPVAVFGMPLRHMFQRKVYSTGVLPYGEHTVRFRVISNRPPASGLPRPYPNLSESRGHFYLDYVEVLGVDPTQDSPPIILSQPQSLTVQEGDSATFTVGAVGHPTPTFQWRKNGVAISDANSSSYTIAAVALTDSAIFDVVVANESGTIISDPADLTVLENDNTDPTDPTEPPPQQPQTELFAINSGTYNSSSGQFAHSGNDAYQGLVKSFDNHNLSEIGDYVRIDFNWSGGGSNNARQQVMFGFFQGDNVTTDGQVHITDTWEGYFHAIGTRNSNGSVNFGVYRQGQGSQPLMDRERNWSSDTAQIDGNGGQITGGHRAALNQDFQSGAASLMLTRISETQIRLSSTFRTARSDGTSSGTIDSIGWTNSSTSGFATVTSTYNLAQGGPTTINALALVAKGNFTVSNVSLSTNQTPPSTPPVFTSAPVTQVVAGEQYSYIVQMMDPLNSANLTLSASQLPYWLTLVDQGNGQALLQGTAPAQIGTSSVELLATADDTRTAHQSFTIQVISGYQEYEIEHATWLSGSGQGDAVRGMRFLSDGRLAMIANISGSNPAGVSPILLNGATSESMGTLLLFAEDGRTLLSATRVSNSVVDIAIDDNDRIYIAAWDAGLLKLDVSDSNNPVLIWSRLAQDGFSYRVDSWKDGTVVVLRPSNPGANVDSAAGPGTLTVYAADGSLLGSFAGSENTQDVAIYRDQDIDLIIHTGWRQAFAHGGTDYGPNTPVQVAFIRARDFSGNLVYRAYGWPVSNSATPGTADNNLSDPDLHLNRWTNNMADTRGLRCSIGADGLLYVAFESAGGNHQFRYNPFDLTQPAPVIGGDAFHSFFNTAAEHKTVFGRFNPLTGEALAIKEFTARRNSDNSGSATRVERGDIQADSDGRVYLGGMSFFGLPIPGTNLFSPTSETTAFNPFEPEYYTGGAYLLVMSPDFTTREYITRLSFGETNAVAVRQFPGNSNNRIAWGGTVAPLQGEYRLHTVNPIQAEPTGGDGKGFFATIGTLDAGNEPGDPHSFEAWIASFPHVPEHESGPMDRPGGSAVTNIESYLFGLTPGYGSINDAVEISALPDGTLSLLYRVNKFALHWNLTPQWSADLLSWHPVSSANISLIQQDSEFYYFQSSFSTTPNTPLFLRIAISLND
ncbi:MAG: immunoglobulin domain-containing protein [Verrucomicrobia bacterium]|nr:immunoglobulin domain-containing protein [Verrucomicrobiota bacterium]